MGKVYCLRCGENYSDDLFRCPTCEKRTEQNISELRGRIDTFGKMFEIELALAELYWNYSEVYKTDREFWQVISHEEDDHALLLKAIRDLYLKDKDFPEELIFDNYDTLLKILNSIKSKSEECASKKLEKKEAYNFALGLENSASEVHYQKLMEKNSDNYIIETLRKLNDGDMDHAIRIKSLIERTDFSE